MSKMTLDVYSCDRCGYSEYIAPNKEPFKLKKYVLPFIDIADGEVVQKEIHLCPKCAAKIAGAVADVFGDTALWVLNVTRDKGELNPEYKEKCNGKRQNN